MPLSALHLGMAASPRRKVLASSAISSPATAPVAGGSAGARLIGISHMAFYRGWLQGLPLREMADMYLDQDIDLRVARSTLLWIRDALRKAALRNGRYGEARLLRTRIAVRSLPEPDRHGLVPPPDIEAFREQVDPSGFHDSETLMGLYLERYPADPKEERRHRLLQRQVDALNLLERMLVTRPQLDDSVHAWFDTGPAMRLSQAGLKTIRQMKARMERDGYHWYDKVRGLGERGAARLLRWLRVQEESLGPVPTSIGIPPRQAAPAVRARATQMIENLMAPSADAQRLITETPSAGSAPAAEPPVPAPLESLLFDASEPTRAEAQIMARNDREAVEAWLDARGGSMATRRSYRKEAERLVLWAVMERGKRLADLTVEDCGAFREWIAGLGRTEPPEWRFRISQETWIGSPGIARHDPRWRPFYGPLSAKSAVYAITVAGSLMGWLTRVAYLQRNPFDALGKARFHDPSSSTIGGDEMVRAFSASQWEAICNAAAALDAQSGAARYRLLMNLAVSTGMRVSEIAGATMGAIYRAKDEAGEKIGMEDGCAERWMLAVTGKGGKRRVVPLLPEVINLMKAAHGFTGASDWDPRAMPPETPLVPRAGASDEDDSKGRQTVAPTAGGCLSPAAVARAMSRVFEQAAAALDARGRRMDAADVRRGTAHWIRHTTGKRLADAGVPPHVIQRLLGHASLGTTGIYTDTTGRDIWDAASRVLRP